MHSSNSLAACSHALRWDGIPFSNLYLSKVRPTTHTKPIPHVLNEVEVRMAGGTLHPVLTRGSLS